MVSFLTLALPQVEEKLWYRYKNLVKSMIAPTVAMKQKCKYIYRNNCEKDNKPLMIL